MNNSATHHKMTPNLLLKGHYHENMTLEKMTYMYNTLKTNKIYGEPNISKF